MTIVLIGPMGAGKSSVGRKLAKRLGRRFFDTDAMLVSRHGAIPKIFAEKGEAEFRVLERAAVAEALEQNGVVSLGGGAVLNEDTQAQLSAHHVALLTVSEQVIAERIRGGNRPLLTDGIASWKAIADARAPIYARLADVVFDTSRRPIEHVVTDLAAWANDRISEKTIKKDTST